MHPAVATDVTRPRSPGRGLIRPRRAELGHTERVDQRLVEITEELLSIVQASSQDVDWQSYYDNEQELIDDLRDHAERMRRGDESRLPELKFSLLPTGDLNEIAFSSGWGHAYARLANLFDELYTGPWAQPRKPSP